MKVNLILEPIHHRNGYVNISPLPMDAEYYIGEVTDLKNPEGVPICCDGEADELIVNEVLEYFPPNQIDQIIKNWVAKLKVGGTITIRTTDIESIARGMVFGNVKGIAQTTELIYGLQEQAWKLKKSAFSLHVLCGILESHGLKIIKKIDENFMCCVVARRVNAN